MVSKLLTFITGQLNPWIIESTHSLKQSSNQARRPEFYKYIDYLFDFYRTPPPPPRAPPPNDGERMTPVSANLCPGHPFRFFSSAT